MARVSLFKSNKSQALRLPKPVAYPDTVKQVDIVIQGRTRIITPAGESWISWKAEGNPTIKGVRVFDAEGTVHTVHGHSQITLTNHH